MHILFLLAALTIFLSDRICGFVEVIDSQTNELVFLVFAFDSRKNHVNRRFRSIELLNSTRFQQTSTTSKSLITPNTWKVLKPGKANDQGKSLFSPIANLILPPHLPLAEHQLGFRKQCSTITALQRILHMIQQRQ